MLKEVEAHRAEGMTATVKAALTASKGDFRFTPQMQTPGRQAGMSQKCHQETWLNAHLLYRWTLDNDGSPARPPTQTSILLRCHTIGD